MAGNSKSGRKKLDKSELLVASMARKHTDMALKTLVTLMKSADSDAVKKAACDSILDRGWGKPPQALTGEDGGAIKHTLTVKFE